MLKTKNIDADFISSHIEYFRQRPFWYWWNTMHLKTLSIPQPEFIKSFNSIYRISNQALSYLLKTLSDENSGHHEVFIPTVLNNAGFSLLDYGGIGDFTSSEFKTGFTIRHRCLMTTMLILLCAFVLCLVERKLKKQ